MAKASSAERKLSGHKSLYRRKVRVPLPILLTRLGHVLLAEELIRTGMSRSDYIESLLRKFAAKLKPGERVALAGEEEA